MTSIKTGEKIPINLQLFNRDTSKFPRCLLYKSDGSIYLPPFSLMHISNGLYSKDDITMPNEPLVAQFIVYDDANHTIINTEHTTVSEIFTPLSVSSTSGGLSCEIIGELEGADIVGSVESREELAAAVEQTETQGNISTAEVTGDITGKEIDKEILDSNIDGLSNC